MEIASGGVKPGSGPPRAIVYCRVSTDEQAASGLGIEAQLHACSIWAGREGREPAGSFIDDGVSSVATLEERPALIDALTALAPGDVLLVAKRDRLGRDPVVVALIERAVERKGGRVVSAAGEGTENDDPSNILMRRIIDAFAEHERLLIRARTKAALAAKKRRGERVGQLPFGHDLAADGVTLVPNLADLAAVELMAEWKAAGWSLRKIAGELNRLGVKALGGKPWRHSSVASILRRGGVS